jgi:hypothetical protein
MLVQKVLEQVQAELEETEIAAVCAMNALIPAVDHAEYAKVDHPDVGKTSGDQQASQALWLADMTLVELKAATFLVGKESFNPHALFVVAARFFQQAKIGDQVKWLAMLLVPPDDNQDWAIGLLSESDIVEWDATATPGVDFLQTQPFAVQTDLGVLGGAADVAPAKVVHIASWLESALSCPA